MSGLNIGPWALFLAVLAYVLKRWWDRADSITEARRVTYSVYFSACYELAKNLMHDPEFSKSSKLDESYERFQKATPDFYLHASPVAISISDIFFERFGALRDATIAAQEREQLFTKASDLNEALIILREVLKSEIYFLEPRFQLERWRHKQKWVAFMNRHEKPSQTKKNG